MRISVRQVFESVRYEAYGPGGAVMIMDCLTDSRDRMARELRAVLFQYGGHLGAPGSVDYLFNRVGLMVFPPGVNTKRLIRAALEAGAEEVVSDPNGSIEVLADPIDFETMRARLHSRGFEPTAAKVTERASMTIPLDVEAAGMMVQLLKALKDLNDVQNVYTNVEISDEVLARI